MLNTTDEIELARDINISSQTSPLKRLRERKALYIPSDFEGFNRLLYELHAHEHVMRIVSVYSKPTECFYPVQLLEKIKAPELVRKRAQIAQDALQQGRYHVVEILNEESIWDLIRCSADGKFILYPPVVTEDDVAEHLNHLIGMLEKFSGYELILTRAWFPFHLATYDIGSDDSFESITIFLQRLDKAAASQSSCFVVADPVVKMELSANIVDRILSDTSTLSKRAWVISVLEEVRDHLLNEGPL